MFKATFYIKLQLHVWIMSIERVVKHRQGLTKEEEVKRPLVLF